MMSSSNTETVSDARKDGWNEALEKNSDLKRLSAKAFNTFLMDLHETNGMPDLFHKKPIVLDLGGKEPLLSYNVQKSFEAMNIDGVDYNIVTQIQNPYYQRVLKGATVVKGDMFAPADRMNEELPMKSDPDIVLASHALVDSKNVIDSVRNISTQLKKPSSLAIFVSHSQNDDLSHYIRKFTSLTEPGKELKGILKKLRIKHHTIHTKGHVFFPEISDELWKELQAAKPYNDNTNPHSAHADGLNVRKLVESVINRPLESLSTTERKDYLGDLRKKLKTQKYQGKSYISSDKIIEVVLSPHVNRQTELAVERGVAATNKSLSEIQK